jgi:RHS repeat-associated protein
MEASRSDTGCGFWLLLIGLFLPELACQKPLLASKSPSRSSPCGNGGVDPGEQCDDSNVKSGDGCSETCRFENGWACLTNTKPHRCARTCGDGVVSPDKGEECDEGRRNSNLTPDACREFCKKPACGDRTEDKGEICDSGKANGKPGFCNATCSGYLPAQSTQKRTYGLSPAPPGAIVLVASSVDLESDFSGTINVAEFERRQAWIGKQGFLVGRLMRVKSSHMVDNPLVLYDDGVAAYDGRAMLHGRGGQLGVKLGSFALKPGDLVLGSAFGAPRQVDCPCGTGGAFPSDLCGVPPGSGGFPDVCPEPYRDPRECPAPFDARSAVDLRVDRDSRYESVRGGPSMSTSCSFDCLIMGTQAAQCEEGGGVLDPDVLDEFPTRCQPAPDRNIPDICSVLSGEIGGGTHCPGYCGTDMAGDYCPYLEPKERLLDLQCGIQTSAVAVPVGGPETDECYSATPDQDDLSEILGMAMNDAWTVCIGRVGEQKCWEGISGPLDPPEGDDGFRQCALASRAPQKCRHCSSSLAGGCFPLALRNLTDPFNGSPDEIWPKPRGPEAKPRDQRGLSAQNGQAVKNWIYKKHIAPRVGDPVSMGSGELTMTNVDVSFPSRGVPFELIRSYRSGGLRSGVFGPGWTHSYEERLVPIGDPHNRMGMPEYCVNALPLIRCVLHVDGRGGSTLYVLDPNTGLFVPNLGGTGVIRGLAGEEWRVFDDGAAVGDAVAVLSEPGGTVRVFDVSGVLLSVHDEKGFGVELAYRVLTREQVEARGASTKLYADSLRPIDGRSVEAGIAHRDRTNRLNRIELVSATDSAGRVFVFEYVTRFAKLPLPLADRKGPYRRRRLARVKLGRDTLVEYGYTDLKATNESYLTRVTRRGTTSALAPAVPIVSAYEYAHSLFGKDGAYALDGEGKPITTLGLQVGDVLTRFAEQQVDCITGLRIDFSPTSVADKCGQILVMGDSQTGFGRPSPPWEVIRDALADNIVRVRRGGDGDGSIELETFYEVDPRRYDFDRVIEQRYGAISEPITPVPVQRSDTIVHYWRTNMPTFQMASTSNGHPDVCPPVSTAPDCRGSWFDQGRVLPAVALAAAGLESHAPPQAGSSDVCDLSALAELPSFDPRYAAGDRLSLSNQTNALEATPTVMRTRETCEAIAARHSRDPFLADLIDVSEVDDPSTKGRHREGLEWDLALVCRWVETTDRRGQVHTYGLNFIGNVLVEVQPNPAPASTPVVTRRRYNADGLLLVEERPDGSRVELTYDGQVDFDLSAGSPLKRHNVVKVREMPVLPAAPNLIEGTLTDTNGTLTAINFRDFEFTYEEMFQMLRTAKGPDGVTSTYRYDWQQLGANSPQARARRQRASLLTGIDVQPARFEGRDLDGDGTSGVEDSAGLVLVVVTGVNLGGNETADVGFRYLRDNSGRLREERRVRRAFVSAEDTDLTRYTYYASLDRSQTGALTADCSGCERGPLATTTRVRTPADSPPVAADDLDREKLRYDVLGGISLRRFNDDPATDVVVIRNSMGLVAREAAPGGLSATHTYDAKGELRQSNYRDTGDASTPALKKVFAWGAGAAALGACVPMQNGRCDGFESYARSAVKNGQAGSAMPALLPKASYTVTLLDKEDRDVGSIDSTGGRTTRTRNGAGLVTSTVVEADPNPDLVVQFTHDVMGRVVREAEGAGDLLETFYRYDGLGRLVAAQTRAPLAQNAFTVGAGTIELLRYDAGDRIVGRIVEGDNGAGQRRLLLIERIAHNTMGVERFVHRFAAAVAPSGVPTVPTGGISPSDSWATEELRYDHALRPVYHLPEGLGVPTTARWDGFGLALVNGPNAVVRLETRPSTRRIITTRIPLRDGIDGGVPPTRSTTVLDPAFQPIRREVVDTANNVVRTSTWKYDGLGRLKVTTDPTSHSVTRGYDAAGFVTSIVERRGTNGFVRMTRYVPDSLGRIVTETPEDAPPISVTFDLAGRILTRSSGSGTGRFTTAIAYDSAGRADRVQRTGTTTRTTNWTYAANRDAPESVGVDAHLAKSFVRDGLDRPVSAVNTNLVLDGASDFQASRPRITTRLTYDTLGRVVQDGTSAQFPASGPTPAPPPVVLGSADRTFTSDYLGPSSLQTLAGERLEYRYSERGNLERIERSNVNFTGPASRTVLVEFASQDGLWVQSEIAASQGNSWSLGKGRDGFGFVVHDQLKKKADPPLYEGFVLRGPTGRITAERRVGARGGTVASGFTYDEVGRLATMRVDLGSTITKDAFLEHTNVALSNEGAGAEIITAPDGQPARASFSKADALQTVTADERGRRHGAMFSASADGVPPIVVNGLSFPLDGQDRPQTDGTLTYTFDALDRLVQVRRGTVEELRIAYDGVARRRLERRLQGAGAGTVEDAFLEYDGPNVIEESAVGAPAQVLFTVTHAPGIDAPVGVAHGPTRSAIPWFVVATNARGDAVAATRENVNTLDEEQRLDPWGEREIFLGGSSSPCIEGREGKASASLPQSACAVNASVLVRFGIGGARAHTRTKLVDLRNRVYATHLKSFLTKDPLGAVDSQGLWNYAAGDPINLRDPWGLESSEWPDSPDPAQGSICDKFDAPSPCPIESELPEPEPGNKPEGSAASVEEECDVKCQLRRERARELREQERVRREQAEHDKISQREEEGSRREESEERAKGAAREYGVGIAEQGTSVPDAFPLIKQNPSLGKYKDLAWDAYLERRIEGLREWMLRESIDNLIGGFTGRLGQAGKATGKGTKLLSKIPRARQKGAYLDSLKKVFPTYGNSDYRGRALLAEQKEWLRRGKAGGKLRGTAEGQMSEAGIEDPRGPKWKAILDEIYRQEDFLYPSPK